jgi:FlaA1/EpsC-like NDP-sugar epimerase|tara:strand:+ start:143 stop:1303 length:1161 start_codon:yes stop_codon:yes gene_type:complete
MINEHLYKRFEEETISKVNRFEISKKDLNDLKKSFKNKIVLISGAAGSIGSQFSKDIFKYNFKIKKIIFLDKDENMLTELNRELLLFKNFRKINREFVCSDLNSMDISDILLKDKVQFYLNFAAIKHVRSEENIQSIKYMFKTNSINFVPRKLMNLKKIFSISTDKTVNPSSILGVSKYLMEMNLSKYKNKNIFVSSVRFANVAFSNGSILKYVVDRLIQKKEFGVPENIKRFFITHSEASNLCFKSLLKRNNKKIVIPNSKTLDKDYLLTELVEKITKKLNLTPKFYKKSNITNNYKDKICYILLTSISDGQKSFEEFVSKKENILEDVDKSICKVDLPAYDNRVKFILDKILNSNNIDKLKKYLSIEFKNYQPPKKYIKVSRTI